MLLAYAASGTLSCSVFLLCHGFAFHLIYRKYVELLQSLPYIYIHEFHDRLLKRRDDDLEICLSMDGDGMDGVDLNKAGYT